MIQWKLGENERNYDERDERRVFVNVGDPELRCAGQGAVAWGCRMAARRIKSDDLRVVAHRRRGGRFPSQDAS